MTASIQLRQAKRKRFIDMPITRSLKTLFNAQPRTAATRNGKPWGSVNFDHRWRETVVKADRNGPHFHDLRSIARTVLAQADAIGNRRDAWVNRLPGRPNARPLPSHAASLTDSAVANLEAERPNCGRRCGTLRPASRNWGKTAKNTFNGWGGRILT
ncbi:hypothetical protein ACWGNZ_09545 [Sphingomonas zeae]